MPHSCLLWACMALLYGANAILTTNQRPIRASEYVSMWMSKPIVSSLGSKAAQNKTVTLNVSANFGVRFATGAQILTLQQFDDLHVEKGFTEIGSYSNLTFKKFVVMNTTSASAEDQDCATSLPNALLAYGGPQGSGSLFSTEDAFTNTEGGQTFNFNAYSIKPTGRPDGDVTISIFGWYIRNNTPVKVNTVYMYFADKETYPVSKINLTAWDWAMKDINVLEISAVRDGPQNWPFCMDDIEIEFPEESS